MFDRMEFKGLWILVKNKNEVTGIYNNYFDLPDYFDGRKNFNCSKYLEVCSDDVIYKRSLNWARARIQQSPANADPVFVIDTTKSLSVLYYGFSCSDKLYPIDSGVKVYDAIQQLLHGLIP